MKTRFLALAIAIMMVFAMMPVGVSAAEPNTVEKFIGETKTLSGIVVPAKTTYRYENCNLTIDGCAYGTYSIVLGDGAIIEFVNTTVNMNASTDNAFWCESGSQIALWSGSELNISGYKGLAINSDDPFSIMVSNSTLSINECEKGIVYRANVTVQNNGELSITNCTEYATNGRKHPNGNEGGGIRLTVRNNSKVNVSGNGHQGLDVRGLFVSNNSEVNISGNDLYGLYVKNNVSFDETSSLTVEDNGSKLNSNLAAEEKITGDRAAIMIGANAYTIEFLGSIEASGNKGADFLNQSANTAILNTYEGALDIIGNASIRYKQSAPINFFMYFFMKMFLSEYEITVATEGNGAVVTEAEDLLVQFGNDIVLTPVAEEGAELLSVLVDGVEVELTDAYSFENVKEAHSITFIFSEIVEEEVTEEEVTEEVVEEEVTEEEIVEEVTEEIVDEAADEEVAA